MIPAFRGKTLTSAAIVFLVALSVYSWTLAPTVTLVDSGELILAARCLGVAHPPGFPLYVALAHLASLVPIGNVAQRVNFVSAFFAALACATLTLVIVELAVTVSVRQPNCGESLGIALERAGRNLLNRLRVRPIPRLVHI